MRKLYATAKALGVPGRRYREVKHLAKTTDTSGVTIIAQAERTHCPQGHEYAPENTYTSRSGSRYCKTCNREAVKRQRLKRQTA
jgi:hypothetical protein